jgi:hypothetical protein
VVSFTPDGAEKYIEVKATASVLSKAFAGKL